MLGRLGYSVTAVADGDQAIAKYRERYPEGLLAPALVHLESRLATARATFAGGGNPDERAEKLVGGPAPDFTLKDIDGTELTLSSLRGKPVLLSFWGYT